MSMMEDGGPAFPVPTSWHKTGMSLRDWFAGQALPGILADGENLRIKASKGTDVSAWVADAAYAIADAMIKASKR